MQIQMNNQQNSRTNPPQGNNQNHGGDQNQDKKINKGGKPNRKMPTGPHGGGSSNLRLPDAQNQPKDHNQGNAYNQQRCT